MAVRASATVTLSCYRDTEAVWRYYLLQSSTLSAPDAPTTYPPAGDWTDTEPGYTEGSTSSLYFTDCSVFSDGTFQYSAVSLSSSYEAAKAAYNKAAAAASAAASVETRTTTLETELEAVQGQITAKVWQTDITEITDPLGESVTTLEDQYAQLTTDVNSITLSVGDLTTTVTDQGASIDTITGELALKVDKDDNDQVVSMLNASADVITLTSNRLVIDSDNFTLTAEGAVTATRGTIGGWTITTGKIYASALDDENEVAVMQVPGGSSGNAQYVFAAGESSNGHNSYNDCPFRVTKAGKLYANYGIYQKMLLSNGTSCGIYGTDSDESERMLMLRSDENDHVRLGNSSYPTYLYGSSVHIWSGATLYIGSSSSTSGEVTDYYISPNGSASLNAITAAGRCTVNGILDVPNRGIAIANGYGVYHYLSDGSDYVKFEYLNSSDQFILGRTGYATYLYGSSITANKSITVSSDRRLKQDIRPLDGQDTGLVDLLAPVAYRLKDDPDLLHYGLVAQDVEEALAELGLSGSALVQTNAATGMKSIAYEELIPLLAAEIRKLKETVDTLQKEVRK